MPYPPVGPDPEFTILSDEVQGGRYFNLYNRIVKFPPRPETGHTDGQVLEYDVVGHPRGNFHFAVAFPYHPAPTGKWRDGHVTLIREYCQGPNELLYCLPTGTLDPHKHKTIEDCARAEVSEEAHLKGGELVRLLDDGVAVAEVKWCLNKFTPFVVLGPEPDDQPGDRDKEEFIQIIKVSIPQLKEIMRSGKMLLPSVSTCYWALDYLAENFD